MTSRGLDFHPVAFEHDMRTGRFVCPWCNETFDEPTAPPTEVLDEQVGVVGVVETYSHRCGDDDHVTHPSVITPFPDRADHLWRLVRERFVRQG